MLACMRPKLAPIFAALAIAGGALIPAAAPADTMVAAPIEIDSCLYVHNQAETRYGYRVTFVNVSDQTLTEVRFHVRWPSLGADQYLRDVGTFSPGTTISHTFAAPQIFASGEHCGVVSARFEDGTKWTAQLEDQ
jgi:hypothetical protein